MDKRYCYDLETFPNYFCVTFINPDDDSDIHTFEISESKNQVIELNSFVNREIVLIGFNNIYYDGVILNFIRNLYNADNNLSNKNFTAEIFRFSNKIISNMNRTFYDLEVRGNMNYTNVLYKQIDLMKLNAYDKSGVSLKQISINLNWHMVQDLPLPYDKHVTKKEEKIVLDYNMNDVLITKKLYESLLEDIKLRESLTEEYKVNLMSASDSAMANAILEDIYCKEVGVNIKDIKHLRTEREQIVLGECFGKGIEFKTNILNRVKNELSRKVLIKEDNFKYTKSITFAGVTYELGIGGLHSVDSAGIYESNDDYIVRDCDIASYYPNNMIINNFYPEHLSPKFINILKNITKERIEAKKNKDKMKADSLKITINSIFGKLGHDNYWLYDPKKMISVTISGQLYLLMLIESLVMNGIEVISANTDGIVSRIPKHLESKYYEVCNEFQSKTGFELEYTNYKRYFRSDVNNYLVEKMDGDTKEKGRYLKKIDLKKAYRHPIVPIALYQYFIKGIPLIDTLKESKDILQFCISQKVGDAFVLEYRKGDEVITLQKNNRFFISLNGGKLIKKRTENNSEIGLYVDQNTTVLNYYDPNVPFDSYQVDYSFYENEAKKYIEEIEKNKNPDPVTFEDEPENYVSESDIYLEEKEKILFEFRGIKGLPGKIADNIILINKEFKGDTFLDLLVFCEENSIMSIRYVDLIKINYFNKFGGAKKLITFFNEFTKGKNKYVKALSSKSKEKRLIELKIFWEFMSDEQFKIKEQVKNEIDVCGKVKTKFNINKNYALVYSVNTKYTPKLEIVSLSTGIIAEVKISKATFDKYPVVEGDIVLCKEFKKKNAVRKNEFGKWVQIENKFDRYLESYYITKDNDKLQ